ncbi:hypothetical protein D3C76_1553590 [compost metagenome]
MGAAQQVAAVVEEAVFLPFQPGGAVRAAVEVGVDLAVLAYCEQRQVVDIETPALAFGQRVRTTEQDHDGPPVVRALSASGAGGEGGTSMCRRGSSDQISQTMLAAA